MPWLRASRALVCGATMDCLGVRPGELYYVLSTGKLRCEAHAQGLGLSAPAEVEARPQVPPVPAFSSLRPLAAQAQVDWARRAAGERDE
jgi:hypothetical protein